MKMATSDPVPTLTDVNAEHECLTSLSDTAQDLIKFRLYEDTEGVWVCCDWCEKWRYVAEQKDPAFFFKRDFHCKDVRKKCNVGTEKGFDQTFYETKYCAGSLVWAKRPDGRKEKDWPWWPALVEDSPDAASQYFLLDPSGSQPIAYHVTFLDAYRTSGWVASNLIKPFDPETKSAIKAATSRVGKKQRILREALERATNAAGFDVKDRLENFSYIAHMARLKGFIRATKQPADTILNGMQRKPERQVPQDSMEEEISAPDVKGGRGRPRKRKLETSEIEVVNKKKSAPKPAVIEDSVAEHESPQMEIETVAKKPVVTKSDPTMDVDSGYAVDEESPVEKPVPTGRKRAPPETTKIPEIDSDPINKIASSEDVDGSQSNRNADESQSDRDTGDKPKKREPAVKRKETKPKPTESVKISKNQRTSKNDEQESHIKSSEPIKASKTKSSSERKVSPPKDSIVESLPVTKEEDRASLPDVTDSESVDIIQDTGAASADSDTLSMGFETSVPEAAAEGVIYDSESNTLESTPNLKVVRKRRPKAQDASADENKPPKPASSTQAPRKDKSKKTLGLSKRVDSVTSVGPTPDFSMSQPLPSRSRGKFAPPTRAKPNDGNYTFDDFTRDVHEGAL